MPKFCLYYPLYKNIVLELVYEKFIYFVIDQNVIFLLI